MFQRLTLFSALIALCGCADGGHWMSSEYLIGRGWAKPPEQKAKDPLYCYRTLGEVNCYRKPQTGKGRLVEAVPTKVNHSPPQEPLNSETGDYPISLKGEG